MKSNWMTTTINDVCSLVTDGAHNSPKSVEKGRYMASVKDFTEFGFDFSNCRRISEEDYERLRKQGCVPEKDDILVGKDGARYFEDIVIYKQDEQPALLSSIAILRADRKKIIPEFLYYTLKTPAVKKNVRDNYGSGSAIPRIVLKDFKRMPFSFPSVDEQRKITAICSAIDSKIQVNNAINKNLSDLLQAIYQKQFGEVSLGANQGILSDICSYSKEKVAVSELNVNTYFSTENMLPEKAGSTKATSLPTTLQTTACRKGDTLISNIRPYFKKIVYCEDMCGCSTDVLCFTPVQSQYAAYLFSTLYTDKFFAFMVAGSKGTKMPRGDKQQIMTYPVILPAENELEEFNAIAFPVLEQLNSNKAENKRLSALRDALLPKLMSGELDVSDIDL
ncbi:hypothetical protein HFM88_06735 [Faecalicatena fissicatena]|jgi:probable type I restriction modification system methylase|uniref:restriction endonuclease subunit S n=3 Tax=Lachnospiraceae TaxID=186803 RepID=UPI00156F4842|nr:restriction endonuclease subunit S [Faecalicatena fissicatena]NSD82546.1 hypothetical protein [Faecalicatena fissicatena]NSE63798.1 hypothetical protein [Faecalicatena fissicatena]